MGAITRKMHGLVGRTAYACEPVRWGESLDNGWRCVRSMDGQGSAFWLAVEARRTDSSVWTLVARTADGKRYTVFYTSNNAGQPAFEPHFDIHACSEAFELDPDSMFPIRCDSRLP